MKLHHLILILAFAFTGITAPWKKSQPPAKCSHPAMIFGNRRSAVLLFPNAFCMFVESGVAEIAGFGNLG